MDNENSRPEQTPSLEIALIAGEGTLPLEVALRLTDLGTPPVVYSLRESLGALSKYAWDVVVLSRLELLGTLEDMKRRGIRRVLLAGVVPKTLLYQLLCAALLLIPLAWLAGHVDGARFTPVVWGSLLYQSVLVSFVAFLTWFWLLRRYLASRLGVFSFMTPLFGVLFGMLLLDEGIDAFFVGGGVLVLLGISMVSADGWWRRVLGREPARQPLG